MSTLSGQNEVIALNRLWVELVAFSNESKLAQSCVEIHGFVQRIKNACAVNLPAGISNANAVRRSTASRKLRSLRKSLQYFFVLFVKGGTFDQAGLAGHHQISNGQKRILAYCRVFVRKLRA